MGNLVKKKIASVTANLTEEQKRIVMETAVGWGSNMSNVGRRIIQRLISKNINLLDLLAKYSALTNIEPERKSAAKGQKAQKGERFSVTIKLAPDEKQLFSTLADEGFYLPGELAGILLKLLTMGIIGKDDLW